MLSAFQNRVTDAVYRLLFAAGATRWVRRSDAVIYCYHNVISDESRGAVGDHYLHTTVTDFAKQLDWIASSNRVVPVAEIIRRLRDRQSVAGLAAITFDDGYSGVVRHAIPLMRKAGTPFALFPVIEGASERRPFWWDQVRIVDNDDRDTYLTELQGDYKKILARAKDANPLPDEALPAGWDELKSILGDDCTIGVHTVTHRNLAAISATDVEWELVQARERLATELGTVPTIVSYPYGRSNGVVHEQTRRAGFEAGLGLASNLIKNNVSAFDIPRINVPAPIALHSFACWSSGLKLRR